MIYHNKEKFTDTSASDVKSYTTIARYLIFPLLIGFIVGLYLLFNKIKEWFSGKK